MTIRKNIDCFIDEANLIHNNKYDYTLSKYISTHIKIKIICPVHGTFMQTPNSHLRGRGCSKCIGNIASNNDEFIIKAKLKHNNKYDYSLIDYVNNKIKIIIGCNKHGNFKQTPNNHLSGYGCPVCGGKLRLNNKDFIDRCEIIHNNKYDYTQINYVNNNTKINIICPIHGIFKQIVNSHLNGSGCPKCFGLYKSTNEFIGNSRIVHGNIYDYSSCEYYKRKKNVSIICKIHGLFIQTPHSHLNGAGCPKCNRSKGELSIEKILIENKLDYVTQKKYNDCIGIKNKLSFDFHITKYDILIEYDGKQHFEMVKFNGCTEFQAKKCYLATILNDEIKNNYSKKNNIKLIRIPYYEKNVELFLINEINKHLNIK